MALPTSRKPKQETSKGIFLRYPGPTLAVCTLLTVVFSFGVAWSATEARIQRLEETGSQMASKEELATIKEMIKSLDQKIDILVGRH